LCAKYAVICIEDLNIKAMQQLWGKKISDLSHGSFVNILKYAAYVTGTEVIEISRWYPSSKTRSVCGHVLAELPLNAREWYCTVDPHAAGRRRKQEMKVYIAALRSGGEFPTSNDLQASIFTVCGRRHNRDYYAAINILSEGASHLGLGTLRPAIVG
jgi:transposase